MGPLKLLRHLDVILFFFFEKIKQNYVRLSSLNMSQMNFSVCIHALFMVNGCNFNIKTLKPSMTEQVFFSFFLLLVTVLDLKKIMKFLKLGECYT